MRKSHLNSCYKKMSIKLVTFMDMKTLITSFLLLIHLINLVQCQRRTSKDDDSLSYRHDPVPKHQEYDKKILESLLKEVISDELNKMSKLMNFWKNLRIIFHFLMLSPPQNRPLINQKNYQNRRRKKGLQFQAEKKMMMQ